jgi:nucleotide-binding universal stress UspA family protein
MRLLIPIDATERSRWGVRYAVRQHRVDKPVQVCLLFVAEPVTSLELLRFRTHDEIARFQAESGRYLIEDAAEPLLRAGIPYEAVLREGEVAFQILDAAEQLGCSSIVLPRPLPRLARLLCRDVANEVLSQARGVPVITVDAEGMPVTNR